MGASGAPGGASGSCEYDFSPQSAARKEFAKIALEGPQIVKLATIANFIE